MQRAAQASPRPLLRSPHELGPQSIAFHVAADRVKVLVALHGKRLVSSLVQVAVADAAPMQAPAADVGRGQALHETAQFAILLRPEHEVPVIGHQAPGENPQGHFLDRLRHDPQEGEVVAVGLKDGPPVVASIQDVEDHSTRRDTGSAGHLKILSARRAAVNNGTYPLFCSRSRHRSESIPAGDRRHLIGLTPFQAPLFRPPFQVRRTPPAAATGRLEALPLIALAPSHGKSAPRPEMQLVKRLQL